MSYDEELRANNKWSHLSRPVDISVNFKAQHLLTKQIVIHHVLQSLAFTPPDVVTTLCKSITAKIVLVTPYRSQIGSYV